MISSVLALIGVFVIALAAGGVSFNLWRQKTPFAAVVTLLVFGTLLVLGSWVVGNGF